MLSSRKNGSSEHKLVNSHGIHVPYDVSPSQGDLENLSYNPDSPRLAMDALAFGPSAALN